MARRRDVLRGILLKLQELAGEDCDHDRADELMLEALEVISDGGPYEDLIDDIVRAYEDVQPL